MKLQVVPLPEQRIGEATEAPWLLVLSEATPAWVDSMFDLLPEIKKQIGAEGLLVFEAEVEVVK